MKKIVTLCLLLVAVLACTPVKTQTEDSVLDKANQAYLNNDIDGAIQLSAPLVISKRGDILFQVAYLYNARASDETRSDRQRKKDQQCFIGYLERAAKYGSDYVAPLLGNLYMFGEPGLDIDKLASKCWDGVVDGENRPEMCNRSKILLASCAEMQN